MNGEESVNELLNRSSVFTDETKLDLDYTPDSLPHREDELKQLLWMFRSILQRPGSAAPVALMYAPSGSGKTSLAKALGRTLSREGRRKNAEVRCVHVNCKFIYTMKALVDRIAYDSLDGLSISGAGPDQVFRAVYRRLAEKKRCIFLVLDEVDWFINRTGEEIIEELHRFREELDEPKRLAMLFITRVENIGKMAQLSLKAVNRTFGPNTMELRPYDGEGLKDIIDQRVELAFRDGAVGRNVIDFVAYQSESYGDAYFAIELLWKAGRYADSRGDAKVTPEHVRMAKASCDPSVRRDDLNSLTIDEKLILLSVAQASKDRAYISTEEARNEYVSCCEVYRCKTVDMDEMLDHVQALEKIGFVRTDSKKGERTTTLCIPDVPVAILADNLRPIVAMSMRRAD